MPAAFSAVDFPIAGLHFVPVPGMGFAFRSAAAPISQPGGISPWQKPAQFF